MRVRNIETMANRSSVNLASVLWILLLSALTLAAKLPVVDLGYQLHRASYYNESGHFYKFTGIRYARAPTGELRWRAPVEPQRNRSIIHDGSKANICPQASPAWLELAQTWIPNYLAGKNLNISEHELHTLNSTSHAHTLSNSTISEDCLFLDVLVPSKIFSARSHEKGARGAPVLVWIYGGGYTEGSFTSSGSVAGLLGRSFEGGREGVIYVAMNYRLGAFGWLGGPTMQSDGTANAALHDQRFALKWVRQYIHHFGGDGDRVTIIGESAGAGSIMHQITAYAGLKGPEEVPFQQAIAQSPAWIPQVSNYHLDAQLHRLFELTNTKSMEELRRVPSEKLMMANYLQIYQSQYSLFTYGPSVDGIFVPANPGKLLLQGAFAKNLKVMVGHNSDEGLPFVDPFVKTQQQFRDSIKSFFPTANENVVDYITEDLYPPEYGGSQNYTDPIGRFAKALGEAGFVCNTYYLNKAYNGKTYAYEFSIPPGTHGEDIPYTYYNNEGINPEILLLNTTVAIALQDYITTFAQNGVPTSPDVRGLPKFNMYGPNAQIINLGLSRISHKTDDAANKRCRWWQKELYV